MILAPVAPAQALSPVNPVTVDVGGHPANSGFGVFVEGNVRLANDESESTDRGRRQPDPGEELPDRGRRARPSRRSPRRATRGRRSSTSRGGVRWGPGSYAVNVENQGFTKIADTSTYDAFNRDNNNALVNYRIVPKGQPYNSSRFIDGRTNQQTPASIGTPVPTIADRHGRRVRERTAT